MSASSWIWILLSVLGIVPLTPYPQPALARNNSPCSQNAVLHRQRQCLAEQGIATSHTVKGGDGKKLEDLKESFMEALLLNPPDGFCRDLKKYQRAVPCLYRQAVTCIEPELWMYMPSVQGINTGMQALCDNFQKIDFGCIKDHFDPLFRCNYEKGKKIMQSKITPTDIYCRVFKAGLDCMKSELKPCGCTTVKTYVDLNVDNISPSKCSKADFTRVVCSNSSYQLYVDDGLGNKEGRGQGKSGASIPGRCVLCWTRSVVMVLVIACLAMVSA